MEFTLLPKSPRTTVFLVVALVGAIVFVITSGGKTKRRHGGGPVAAATQAAQVLANLAVPPPDAAPPVPTAATADTSFGENPFVSLDPGADPAYDDGSPRPGDFDGGPEAGDGGPVRRGVDEASGPAGAPRRLTGTIVDGTRRLALIDGRYYAPGQAAGDWRVVFIGPREARLERRGETLTLRVGS